ERCRRQRQMCIRDRWKITGGPTEGALKVLAAKAHLAPVETTLVNNCLLYTSDAADDIAPV
ncbi:hypothetical protein ACNQ08_28100, partial [Enterobacter cloacae complex sp.6730661]|uniref:hypothetical protein n=1 Tax=Enterobacter cloacae complex sp.6730661 TaxID=3397169 RepID=UPI003AAD9D8E